MGGAGVGECGHQASAPASNARAHGARCEFEHGRDLGIVEADLVPEHDRRPEVFGQLGQGGVEHDPIGDLVGKAGRIVGSLLVDPPIVLVDKGRGGASAAPSEFIETCIGRDPVRPGAEFRPAFEPVDPLGDRNERFLGGVERIGVVAGEATADRIDAVIVAPQQRIQRAGVAALGGRNQRVVVELRADVVDPSSRSFGGNFARRAVIETDFAQLKLIPGSAAEQLR